MIPSEEAAMTINAAMFMLRGNQRSTLGKNASTPETISRITAVSRLMLSDELDVMMVKMPLMLLLSAEYGASAARSPVSTSENISLSRAIRAREGSLPSISSIIDEDLAIAAASAGEAVMVSGTDTTNTGSIMDAAVRKASMPPARRQAISLTDSGLVLFMKTPTQTICATPAASGR